MNHVKTYPGEDSLKKVGSTTIGENKLDVNHSKPGMPNLFPSEGQTTNLARCNNVLNQIQIIIVNSSTFIYYNTYLAFFPV